MGEKPTHYLLVALPSRQPGTISLQSSCCLTAFHSCGSYLQSVQFSAWFSYAGRVFRGDPIPQGVVTPARLQHPAQASRDEPGSNYGYHERGLHARVTRIDRAYG